MDEDYEQFNEDHETVDDEDYAGPEGAFMRGYKEAQDKDEEAEEED